jgi:prevent-host-death family protein
MHSVNVTALRAGLFEILDQVKQGEVVVVERRGKPVAKIVPAEATNWREGVTVQTRLLVPAEQAFAPMDELWKGKV